MTAPTWTLHAMHVPGAHPERDRIAADLTAAGACLHLDPTRRGIIPTWRDMITCATGDTTDWCVFMQDDTLLWPGWQPHLTQALRHAPTPFIGLSYGGKSGREAAAAGYAWMRGRNNLSGWGYAIYRHAVTGLVAFTENALQVDPTYPHDDRLVSCYAWLLGHPEVTAARAIVGHADVPSLVGHPTSRRELWTPALTINDPGPPWSTPGVYRRNTPAISIRQRRIADALVPALKGT